MDFRNARLQVNMVPTQPNIYGGGGDAPRDYSCVAEDYSGKYSVKKETEITYYPCKITGYLHVSDDDSNHLNFLFDGDGQLVVFSGYIGTGNVRYLIESDVKKKENRK